MATEVSDCTADMANLIPLTEQTAANTGKHPVRCSLTPGTGVAGVDDCQHPGGFVVCHASGLGEAEHMVDGQAR